jgi:hypothetical protein
MAAKHGKGHSKQDLNRQLDAGAKVQHIIERTKQTDCGG